jgi:hypothetical protein
MRDDEGGMTRRDGEGFVSASLHCLNGKKDPKGWLFGAHTSYDVMCDVHIDKGGQIPTGSGVS